MVLQILTYTHHTTTMLFGIFLSAFFLGVKQDKKNILQLLSLAVVSGILYVLCVLLFGTETVDQIYPLIAHAPLLFVLVLHYKFRILPSLIFMGVGAMTDFGPLIANPQSFLLGAAAQFGIYSAYSLAIFMGFNDKAAAAISIIGGADGPTSIFLAVN